MQRQYVIEEYLRSLHATAFLSCSLEKCETRPTYRRVSRLNHIRSRDINYGVARVI